MGLLGIKPNKSNIQKRSMGGFSKTDSGVGPKIHFTLFAESLIAEAPFTSFRAGSGEIEVGAIADGFVEGKGL